MSLFRGALQIALIFQVASLDINVQTTDHHQGFRTEPGKASPNISSSKQNNLNLTEVNADLDRED